MRRNLLSGTAASVFLGLCGAVLVENSAHAQTTGGGSTTTTPTYPLEMNKYNTGSGLDPRRPTTPPASFSTYWAAGSAIGQEAFLNDDLSCDINAVTGENLGACSGAQGVAGNTVSYAASDAALSPAQIAAWSASGFGQALAADLVQLPAMGAGVAIAVVNSGIGANGELAVSDNDLCGVFSGRITDFSGIGGGHTKAHPGPITVYYSQAAEGPTLWLTGHLAAVCNGGNSSISFTPTTTFASLFSGAVPGNFLAEPNSAALAGAMSGCDGAPAAPGLGYLTPDYTSVDRKSNARATCLGEGSIRSKLVVAALFTASDPTPFLPTVKDIALGLSNPASGSDLLPPSTQAQGANPANWAPFVQTVRKGYPVVGYTNFDFAQCDQNTGVAAAIVQFLTDHYEHVCAGCAESVENANGFVQLSQITGAYSYLPVIETNILANSSVPPWNQDIGDASVCGTVTGR